MKGHYSTEEIRSNSNFTDFRGSSFLEPAGTKYYPASCIILPLAAIPLHTVDLCGC